MADATDPVGPYPIHPRITPRGAPEHFAGSHDVGGRVHRCPHRRAPPRSIGVSAPPRPGRALLRPVRRELPGLRRRRIRRPTDRPPRLDRSLCRSRHGARSHPRLLLVVPASSADRPARL